MTSATLAMLVAVSVLAVVIALMRPRSDVVRRTAAIDTAGAPDDEASALGALVGVPNRDRLQQRLVEAGWYRVTPAAFIGSIVVSTAIGAAAGFGVAILLHASDLRFFGIAALLAVGGALLPRARLDRAIAARKLAIGRALPDWLDIISTSVEAGTAVNGALAGSVDAVSGPLADELREVLADIRLGRSRADALGAMAQRVHLIDLTAVVTAIAQTDRLGGNIGGVLDELAADARNHRLMRAEEMAARLPVKMVFPMALFMLPALFVMIFGPVVADLLTKLP